VWLFLVKSHATHCCSVYILTGNALAIHVSFSLRMARAQIGPSHELEIIIVRHARREQYRLISENSDRLSQAAVSILLVEVPLYIRPSDLRNTRGAASDHGVGAE